MNTLARAVALAALASLAAPSAIAGSRSDDAARGVPNRIVTGDLPQYPRDAFVIGVGHGRNADEARDLAVRSVAAQVSARLKSTETLDARLESATRNGDRESADTERYDSAISVETSFSRVDLVENVEVFKGRNAVWVVAVLDKAKATAALRSRVDGLVAEAQRVLQPFGEEAPPQARAQVADIARRARQEWADLAAIAGDDAPAWPHVFDAAASAYGDSIANAPVSLCLFDDGKLSRAHNLSETFLLRGVNAGQPWRDCDRTAKDVTIVDGRIAATLVVADGAGAPSCETRLDFRVSDATATVVQQGTIGGVTTRVTGATEAAACAASVDALLGQASARLVLP